MADLEAIRKLAEQALEQDKKAMAGPLTCDEPIIDHQDPECGHVQERCGYLSVEDEDCKVFCSLRLDQSHEGDWIVSARTREPKLARYLLAFIAFAKQGLTNENGGDWADSYEALDAALREIEA